MWCRTPVYVCLHLSVWKASVFKCYVSPCLLRFKNAYSCCLQEPLLLLGTELLWCHTRDVQTVHDGDFNCLLSSSLCYLKWKYLMWNDVPALWEKTVITGLKQIPIWAQKHPEPIPEGGKKPLFQLCVESHLERTFRGPGFLALIANSPSLWRYKHHQVTSL